MLQGTSAPARHVLKCHGIITMINSVNHGVDNRTILVSILLFATVSGCHHFTPPENHNPYTGDVYPSLPGEHRPVDADAGMVDGPGYYRD